MPRSSRHKSSKHSAREAREYSDAEREPVLKERKGREDGGSGGGSSRHLKDSTSGEKRKLESKSVDVSKDTVGLGVVEYNDGYGGGSGTVSSSKKRKEKVVDDRWTGGDSKEEHELLKSEMKREKEKEEGRGSGDSKRSSRREDAGFHAEEGKRSGSKVESKHHRSERKERGEEEAERERKGSRSDRLDRSEKSERLVDIVSVSEITAGEEKKRQVAEERGGKHGGGNSDWNLQEGVRNPEPEKDTDRRVRRKRDDSGDGDRHQDGVRDLEDRRMSSRDEIAKYAKYKDNGQKDERNRDRFQEDIDKDGWDQDEKQRDNRSTRDHNSGRSDEKHMRNEKKDLDPSLKKSKPHTSEYDRELDRDNKERDKDRDYDRDRGRERERDSDRSRHDHDRDREHDDREPEPDRERERGLGRVNDRERDLERVHDRERDLERVHDRERDLERVHDRERDLDRVHDRDRDLDRVHDLDRDLDRVHDRERDLDRVHDRDRDLDREREVDRVHDRERDLDRVLDRERDHDRVHDRERDLDRVHDRERDLDRVHDRERGRDRYRRERDRVHERNNDRGRERDIDHDHEYASHVDEKGSRYKDDRGRRRSADGYDGYHGDKVRRVDSDVDKDRSLSRKPNVDGVPSCSRHRASPSSRSYVGPDRYRDGIHEDTKYGEQLRDKTMAEAPDKVSKYRSGEKRAKFDETYIGELSERSPSTKASPAGMKERSSPSTFDRSRFPGRRSRRRSLDVDEVERRSIGSNELRDISATEDRQSRDFSAKKSIGDEYPSADSSVYHKSSQGNMSSHGPGPGPGPSPSPGPGPSFFRAGADSPSFVSSFGEDSRGHSGNRYRRSVDPNLGRGPGNAWKGVHNWPSPLPNGFMPFPPPPGPHHGGFPPILSQFPPLFGVRPSMDMNHPGMPYHMADGDRYPGHIRPIGWPSMVDGSIPPHFHGWDGGNGILRDEHMYGPGHPANAQRRDMNAEIWKQNGDIHADVTSGSQKDGNTIKASADEASSAQGASRPNVESSCFEDQGTSLKKDTSSALSPMKEIPFSSAKINTEKTPESSSVDDTAQSLRAYLSKLDVSIDLADPELYNQFINLAVKEQSEYIEDDLELVYTEDKAIVELETPNIIVDVKLFPAAKDSIFQRVMDLYKTQYTKRRNSVGLDGNKICAPASQPEAIQSSLLDETAVFPDDSVMEEEQTLAGPEEIVPSAGEGEGKELECTGVEIQNDDPLPSTEPAIDVGDERLPVLDVEKMEEDAPLDLMSENAPMDLISENAPLDLISKNAPLGLISEDAGKGILPVVSIAAETTDSNTDKGTRSDGDTIYGCESAPGEHLDVAVSSPLNLSDDSVKVCEPLISVPNESESVILSRIHHAPESTH